MFPNLSDGPDSHHSTRRQRRGGLARVLCVVLGLSSVYPAWVNAQPPGAPSPAASSHHGVSSRILADREASPAHRPVILRTANGVPQVQITTPSERGVSRNVYRQFDVGTDGAILNNARTATSTQLGGVIGGNPWLAKGSARVILNEVNTSDPSQLRGLVEVAGERAEVIIANPSGIQVDGGGFLNASQVSLNTGRPVFEDGRLSGYQLGDGTLYVTGAGLNTRRSDYTHILTRAMELNAALWANEVQAELGGEASAPRLMLDVSALGGMYANKIFLVGSPSGLGGIRNAGEIGAMAGELVVRADGWLENRGRLQSTQSIELNSQTLDNRGGQIAAGDDLQIAAPTLLNTEGHLLAGRDLSIKTDALPEGTLSVQRDLSLFLQEDIVNHGTFSAPRHLQLSTAGHLENHGHFQAPYLSLQAQTLTNTLAGRIASMSATQLSATGRLINHGQIEGASTWLSAQAIENSGTVSGDDVSLSAQGQFEHSGTIHSTDTLAVQAERLSLSPDAQLSGGDVGLDIGGDLELSQTRLEARDALHVRTGGDLSLSAAGLVSGGELTLQIGRDLQLETGSQLNGEHVAVEVVGDTEIAGAQVQAEQSLRLSSGGDVRLTSTQRAVSETTLSRLERLRLGLVQRGRLLGRNRSSAPTMTGTTLDQQARLAVTDPDASGLLAVISGGNVHLQGAAISNAGTGLTALVADGELNVDALQHEQTIITSNSEHHHTTHTLSEIEGGGDVLLQSGHDLNLHAAQLSAGHALVLDAGQDLISATVSERARSTVHERPSKRRTRTTQRDDETLHGSVLEAGEALHLNAGRDLRLTATQVLSEQGGLALSAARDLQLLSGQEAHHLILDERHKKKRLAPNPSIKRTHTHDEWHDLFAIGSVLSGETLTLQAGRDLEAQGAQLASTHDQILSAGRDQLISTAEHHHSESHYKQVKRTGVISNGTFGRTVGKQTTTSTAELTEQTHQGSLVGSTDGHAALLAEGALNVTGSTLLARNGLELRGATVSIDAAADQLDIIETQKVSQMGVNISLKGALTDSLQAIEHHVKRADQVQDDRLAALHLIKAGQSAMSGVNSASQAANGNSGLSLRIGIGASSSRARSQYHATQTVGSQLLSEGDIQLTSTEGGLNVTGSQIAGHNVTLSSARDLWLQSHQHLQTQRDHHKSSSGEVGITIGSEAGIGVYISASLAKGNGQGEGLYHSESHIKAHDTLTLSSARDTTLTGAQATGEHLHAQIGRDLRLLSQQDSNDYHRQDMTAGLDFAVGTGGASVSGHYGQSKIDSTWTSVQEQTGFQAGDRGYRIQVAGHTHLTGAAIASTATADNNHLETNSLSWTNLNNEADYSAKSVSVSGGAGSGGGSFNASIAPPQQDKARSTTRASIAEGTLIVHDNSGSDIHRGATELQQEGLKDLFDLQTVSENMELGQLAGEMAFRAVGDLTQHLTKDHTEAHLQAAAAQAILENPESSDTAKAQAQHLLTQATTDHKSEPSQYSTWTDGGPGKTLLHTLAGALVSHLGGGDPISGALGAGTAELTRPLTATAPTWAQQLTSLGIGTLTGGTTGASSALMGEQYNRQLHPDELKTLTAYAKAFARTEYGCDPTCTDEELIHAEQRLIIAAARSVDARWENIFGDFAIGNDPAAEAFLNTLPETTHPSYTKFAASDQERHNAHLFADTLHNTPEWDQFYVAVLSQARTDTQWQDLLHRLNNTHPTWLERYVDRAGSWRLQQVGGVWLDIAPVSGEYRAFKDAETASDYAWASVGAIPLVGDAASAAAKVAKATKAVKGAKHTTTPARNVIKASNDVYMPENRVGHIFRNKDGHIPDTPQNRVMLVDLANNKQKVLGSDRHGNMWAAEINADGSQTWVQYRGDKIINGGVNKVPRVYNPKTGLSAP